MPSSLGIVASGAGFSPLSLSPALWLDASDTSTITASGGLVSQWNDKSGNARNVSQGTAGSQPSTGTATLNGLNVISFNTKSLATSNLNVRTWFDSTALTNTTVIYCARIGNSSDNKMSIGAQTPSSSRLSLDSRNTISFYDMANASGARLSGDDGLRANTVNIVSIRRNGSSLISRRNGSQKLSLSSASGTVADVSTPFVLGVTDGNSFTGDFAELLIFPAAISDSNVVAVESYLNAKWAVY